MARTLTAITGFGLLAAAALAFLPARQADAAAMMASTPKTAGDPVAGAQVFERCAMCHTADKGAGNRVGPNLFGVVGRKAGTVPNFPYSTALKESGITWTDDKLKEWVAGPQKMLPGTRMMFSGLSDQKQIDDLIAYLNSKK